HVAHLIFGRKDAGRDSPTPYIHRPEVVWIGQSVFVMPRSIATELAAKLRGLGAIVTMPQVSMAFGEIEAFRRRASQRHVPYTCLRSFMAQYAEIRSDSIDSTACACSTVIRRSERSRSGWKMRMICGISITL